MGPRPLGHIVSVREARLLYKESRKKSFFTNDQAIKALGPTLPLDLMETEIILVFKKSYIQAT